MLKCCNKKKCTEPSWPLVQCPVVTRSLFLWSSWSYSGTIWASQTWTELFAVILIWFCLTQSCLCLWVETRNKSPTVWMKTLKAELAIDGHFYTWSVKLFLYCSYFTYCVSHSPWVLKALWPEGIAIHHLNINFYTRIFVTVERIRKDFICFKISKCYCCHSSCKLKYH